MTRERSIAIKSTIKLDENDDLDLDNDDERSTIAINRFAIAIKDGLNRLAIETSTTMTSEVN
jgi:hypothetical protein